MKKSIILFSIINMLCSICLFFINNSYVSLFNLLLLIILLIITLKKSVTGYMAITFILIGSTITMFSYTKTLYFIIYLVFFLINMILSFKYVFELFNSFKIKLEKISIPKDKEYLIVKYMNMNGIVVKMSEEFIVSFEDKNLNVENISIKFKDIKNIKIEEKPYNVTMEKLGSNKNVPINYSKIIKSYSIRIILKNKEYILTSFDNPNIFTSFN